MTTKIKLMPGYDCLGGRVFHLAHAETGQFLELGHATWASADQARKDREEDLLSRLTPGILE